MSPDSTPKSADHLCQSLLHEAGKLARRYPANALGAAFGAGMLLSVLPKRFVVTSITCVVLTVLRPALFTLGMIKAAELLSQPQSRNDHDRSTGTPV